MKVVIIGGVAGGASAAARLRRLDETAQIIILERSGYVSYANCGLPYYIGGVITDKESLTLQTPESFKKRFNIDVRIRNEAEAIDRPNKTIRVRRLDDDSEYYESFDKLILSPGAHPLVPDVPGVKGNRIFTLRTVEDCLQIRTLLEKNHARKAVVIGGGFIGLEMAENLILANVSVTLLQRSAHVLPPFDFDMACQIHAYLRTKGLDLRLNCPISSYEETDHGIRVICASKEIISADFVILSIGVQPETHLAKEAGLQTGLKDAIVVDEHMCTSDPDIYAVGDAVEVRQFVSGQKALIALAGPANKQGRIAADAICEKNSAFSGSQGSSILKLFELTAASTGLNEKSAQSAKLKFDSTVSYSASHASYYPGAHSMTIKTLFLPETGKIIGTQIIGFDGVDKRIDVFAAAIRAGMTASDLQELDLTYAPPFSSAKDPVNMTGYIIENLRSGLVKQVHWNDLEKMGENVSLLDVRTEKEYLQGHIPGSMNIPLDELRERLNELDIQRTWYVNCFSGQRSYLACRILTQHGYDCYNFSGGYHFYSYVARESGWREEKTWPCGQPQ